MMDASTPRLGTMGLSELIETAVVIYRRNLAAFAAMVALLAVPHTALGLLLNIANAANVRVTHGPHHTTHVHVINVVLNAVYYPSAIFLTLLFWALESGVVAAGVTAYYRGSRPSVGAAYAEAARAGLLALLAAALIYALVVVVGLAAVIVPGVFLAALFVFTPHALVLGRLPPRAAMGRSAALVRGPGGAEGAWLRTFGTLLVFLLIVGVSDAVLSAIAASLSGGASAAVSTAVSALVSILVKPIALIGATLLYYDLRIRREGFHM